MSASLALALIAGALLQAPKADTTRPPPRTLDELRTRITEVLDTTHTPGVSIALVTRDSVLWAGALGKANVASNTPATAQTLFRIGSTSKAFTSLGILMLQEEGKLRLEDPIKKYIPEIVYENRWEATDPVRIVNALEHTTGFDDWAFRDYASSDPTPLTLRQGLDFNPATRVSRWRPGTRTSYCNTGPPLAAYILEKLEGKTFEEIMQARLFDPIGMKTATFLFPDTTRAPMATLYASDGKSPRPYWYVVMRPAGSINASAEDMAQYVRFLLNRGAVNGRQLVSAASIDRLERTEQSLEAKAGLTVGYGLHMGRYVDSAFVWTGHDGGVDGGLTQMAYLPEQGVGFAFMINASNGEATQKIGRVVRDYLTRDLPRPAKPAAAAMPDEARTRFTGWYRPDNPRAQHIYFIERLGGLMRVTADDSSIVLRPLVGKATRYLPVSGLTFRRDYEPVATLALMSDTANARPVAIEQMGYLLPTSFVHVSSLMALTEVGLTAIWIVGVVLTIIAVLTGLVRLVRRRRTAPSHARLLWRVAIATTLALTVGIVTLLIALGRGTTAIGRLGPLSLATYCLILAFAGLALAGVVLALGPGQPTGGRWSLWTARVVVAANFITAAYLTYWDVVGWRLWA